MEPERAVDVAVSAGVHEFIRYRGALTIEVVVQGKNGAWSLIWYGAEEIRGIDMVSDNSAYVSGRYGPIIEAQEAPTIPHITYSPIGPA